MGNCRPSPKVVQVTEERIMIEVKRNQERRAFLFHCIKNSPELLFMKVQYGKLTLLTNGLNFLYFFSRITLQNGSIY